MTLARADFVFVAPVGEALLGLGTGILFECQWIFLYWLKSDPSALAACGAVPHHV